MRKSESIKRDEVILWYVDNSACSDALYTLFFRERREKPSVSLFEFELISSKKRLLVVMQQPL